MQEVEKKVNLFEMVAKSFIAAIDAGDYRGAFRMMAERLDISNTADAAAIKGAREKAFEDFTATVKGAPAFQGRARIDYGDVALTDDAMKRAEVHARITVKNGDTFDVMWSISEVPDGWRINYFLTGRRFPP
jgi:ketosteroid isomerase-like protein